LFHVRTCACVPVRVCKHDSGYTHMQFTYIYDCYDRYDQASNNKGLVFKNRS